MPETQARRGETNDHMASADILVEIVDDQAMAILDINGSC